MGEERLVKRVYRANLKDNRGRKNTAEKMADLSERFAYEERVERDRGNVAG